MKQGHDIIEQAAESLKIGTKLEDAMVIAVCADNSVYWLRNMTVRPPLDAVPFDIEHIAKWLGQRIEQGGPLPPGWSTAPPRKP